MVALSGFPPGDNPRQVMGVQTSKDREKSQQGSKLPLPNGYPVAKVLAQVRGCSGQLMVFSRDEHRSNITVPKHP